MKQKISIIGIQSVSALGATHQEIWEKYKLGKALFSPKKFDDVTLPVAIVSSEIETLLTALKQSNSKYKQLDRSVLLAMLASHKMLERSSIKSNRVGINIGSSRGATALFEKYHQEFSKHRKISAYASPTTTLGNISSWVGQYLKLKGVKIEHSVTCSTAMHAILNGIAWLQADMADTFLVGGSEAAITPFTMAQMQALKLYSKNNKAFPCESLHLPKKSNTMVLGEAAAVAILQKGLSENRIATIAGYGFASEVIKHNSAISQNALCFQESMQMALEGANLKTVDAIVMHAPGTIKGDQAEMNAIHQIFSNKKPLLTTNKALVGHTFAASGMLSIEMAILMLQHQQFIENPFYKNPEQNVNTPIHHILINAVGFGGNAVSIIVENPKL